MACPITAPELVKLRSSAPFKGQFSRPYLAIHKPTVVMTAMVNQTFPTTDQVIQVIYDFSGGGIYTSILPGQVLWVGSAPGLQDIGKVRIRKPASGSVLYLAENSDIAWADNLYLTITDELNSLWARHIRIDENMIPYMDWDIGYSNQHTAFAPVPVMGPPAVAWLTGATVTIPFDGSASWDFLGTPSYSWAFPGATSTTGLSTATPTATYNAAGVYRAALTVSYGGVSTTGYRYVFIYDASHMPTTQFTIGDCNGDYQRGGWEFSVTLYAEADIANVQEGAQVILFAKDYYNGVEESLGPVAGRENIIAVGWIDTEDLDINPVAGTVTFAVKGPQYWIGKMTGFPVGIQNTTATPAAWTDMQNLTVDKLLFSFLYYRSTVFTAMDCTLTGDTRVAASLEAPMGTLWNQIVTISDETIFARPACDRYGRMFVEINPQYAPAADRAGIPTVMTLTKADYLEHLTVNRTPHSSVSRVELSGIAMINNTANSFFSLANGHIFKHYGTALQKERLLLSSQAQANVLAGLVLQKENLTWNFDFVFAENNRFIDIAPRQYLDMVVTTGDNPRGVAYSGHTFPRSVRLEFHADSNALLWGVQTEQATSETSLIQNGDIPVTDAGGTQLMPFKPASFPPLPPLPAIPSFPTAVPGLLPQSVWIATNAGVFYTQNFNDVSPFWVSANGGILPADIPYIKDMQVNKFGQMLCIAAPTGDGGQRLYTAPMGGQATRAESSSTYFLVFPDPPWFYGIGTNPFQQNAFAFIIGDGAHTKIYTLDVSTLHATETFDFASGPGGPIHHPYQSIGSMNYIGQDVWMLTIGVAIFNWQYIVRMKGDLARAFYESPNYGGYGAGQAWSIPSAGLADKEYYPALNSFITAIGVTLTALPSGTQIVNSPGSIAGDSTGQFIMLQNDYGGGAALAQKSVNGGTSFSTVTHPMGTLFNHSAIQSLGSGSFLWAAGSVSSLGNSAVYHTPDQGTTWVDKTGNLRAVAGTDFQPVVLKAVV